MVGVAPPGAKVAMSRSGRKSSRLVGALAAASHPKPDTPAEADGRYFRFVHNRPPALQKLAVDGASLLTIKRPRPFKRPGRLIA
jgi:hypothetical protein